MTRTHDPRQNRLLAALPDTEWARLQPRLELTAMPLGHVLYESGMPLQHVYFPTNCIVSLLYVMEDGRMAGLHHVVERDDGGGREVRVLKLFAGSIDHGAEGHGHQLQVRRQVLELGAGQGGKRMILAGVVNRCHGVSDRA